MKRRVFHILPPDEPFSTFDGGAISRWAGNALRGDESAVVVCARNDRSWDFPIDQVREVRSFRYFNGTGWLPRLMTLLSFPYEWVVSNVLSDLSAGDVVWVHNGPVFAAFLSGYVKRKGAHMALHMHNSIHWRNKRKLRRVMGLLSAHSMVFVSRFLESEVAKDHPGLKSTFVLHNGADATNFKPLSDRQRKQNREKTIVFSGRLIPEKGVHVLIEAMRLLESRRVAARCIIAGTSGFGTAPFNEYASQMQARAPGNVNFIGYCSTDHLANLLRTADIFCCPSTWNEPFGMVIVEAMASGVPVIASSVGGIPEVLQYGGGVMVPTNDIGALATALQNLLTDSRLRREIAKQGLEAFRSHFTWEKIIQDRYRGILREIAT